MDERHTLPLYNELSESPYLDHTACQSPAQLNVEDNNNEDPNPSNTNNLDAQINMLEEQSEILDKDISFDFQLEVSSAGEPTGNQGGSRKHIPKKERRSSDSQKTQKNKPSMKDQDKTIDQLTKEIFGLKLKIFFLEKKLVEQSPDQVESALKENVNLKVKIQTLSLTVKEYRDLILKLHKAVDTLENKKCTLPHGISEEEQARYDTAIAQTETFREENNKLHGLLAKYRAENTKLRASVMSQQTSRNTSPLLTSSDGDDRVNYWVDNHRLSSKENEAEMYRKEYLQAKQTIEEQNREIKRMSEELSLRLNGHNENHIVKSILSDRDALMSKMEQCQKTNLEMQQNMTRARERNTELVSQMLQKDKELDKMQENVNELVQSLHEAKHQLRCKMSEFEHMRKERMENASGPEVADLLDSVERLREECDTLYVDCEEQQKEIATLRAGMKERTQECLILEKEMEKVVEHAEKLEKAGQEKDNIIDELETKLENMSQSTRFNNDEGDEEIEHLQRELQQKEDQIEEYKQQMEDWRKSDKIDASALEERFAEVNVTMQQKDARLKEMEVELENTLSKAWKAKKRYEDDLRAVENELQGLEQMIRERDVRIASLEGDLVAHTDAVQREKSMYHDDIRDLEERLRASTDIIKKKEALLLGMRAKIEDGAVGIHRVEQSFEIDLAGLKEQLWSRLIDTENEWKSRVEELEERLEESERRLKRDHRLANKTLMNYDNQHQTLKQRMASLQKRNAMLTDLVSQYRQPYESKSNFKADKTEQLLRRLNDELQKELDERDRALEHESTRVQKLEKICNAAVLEKKQLLEEKEHMEQQLFRRNNMFTRTLERLQNETERKEVAENVLFKQATEDIDVVLRRQDDSAIESR
ncbi:hypothetical protein DFQ30_001706 [Apophysomyces sp. BC1015]|nr:hypothetical protein DFQ30_001706 [Apophysomyces sp. BC1015]